MKKRIALLVYPDFSLQEIANLMYIFRWYFDTFTDVIYTELSPVRSEEGVLINPVKTCFPAKAAEKRLRRPAIWLWPLRSSPVNQRLTGHLPD